ncbi:hypothetical protein A3I40_01620 [Candidatus Uhrbacteria bacterium RIFCSPLOWO2_02_FULL_48_12]|uniref:Uncharacterized protein n=1 Tax=Candidatus Uhrbacteria bacterium RIFCSPLOWO2_02_FULL_48_12 TaxID=1802407 RepID=A0A1F7VBE6_9BACT|nr:MAG: hypothetical protein A3I40_01620 [Candidatus Uhrbacteria bacterium RIFCSPLOWO2_02_FULL_48_12]
MTTTLNLSLLFLAIYIILCFKPGTLYGYYQILVGIFYFLFSVIFLIFIYQYSSSIVFVILTILGLFIFMYFMQFVIGSIKYYLKKK